MCKNSHCDRESWKKGETVLSLGLCVFHSIPKSGHQQLWSEDFETEWKRLLDDATKRRFEGLNCCQFRFPPGFRIAGREIPVYCDFDEAKFLGDVQFENIAFQKSVSFRKATFGKPEIHSTVTFQNIQFAETVDFTDVSFHCDVIFEDVFFSKHADFLGTQAERELRSRILKGGPLSLEIMRSRQ